MRDMETMIKNGQRKTTPKNQPLRREGGVYQPQGRYPSKSQSPGRNLDRQKEERKNRGEKEKTDWARNIQKELQEAGAKIDGSGNIEGRENEEVPNDWWDREGEERWEALKPSRRKEGKVRKV